MPRTAESVLNRLRPVRGRVHPRQTLQKRIMVLTAICVALSTLAIGTFSYLRIRTETLDLARANLASEARALTQRFYLDYHLLASDLKTTLQTPPVQGLVRTLANNGIDPLDGSTDALWRARLATIFRAVLSGRPSYEQFRYIGLHDGGRELVRVNSIKEGAETVSRDDLQRKQDEPYFSEARFAPSGVVIFSDVTYNREHGRIDDSGTPMLRAMLPVDAPNGERFGFLVINVNYEKMLQTAFQEIRPKRHTFVVNAGGDFMEHRLGEGYNSYHLEVRARPTRPLPGIIQQVIARPDEEGIFFSEDSVGYFVLENGRFDQESANLGVVIEMPQSEYFAAATKTRDEFLFAGLLVFMISSVASVFAARWMMQPLSDLAEAVRYSGPNDRLDALPTWRDDEIGELAGAIHSRNTKLIEMRDTEVMESRIRAEAIVNNVIDGLILIDETGIIEQFNPSCERMFGYPAKEVIGTNISRLMTPEIARQHDGFLKRYREQGGGRAIRINRELEAVDRNGRVFPIDLAINVVTVEGEQKFSGVIRDITERKAVENMQREFVSTVSHELRTPLTSIRGSLALIDSLGASLLPAKPYQLLGMAQKNTERLIQLVNDILDFEKLRASKVHFDLQDANLGDEIVRAVELNEGFAEDAGVELVAAPDNYTMLVSVDTGKLQQVLGNLISNAVKFSYENGRVEVRTAISGRCARIEVEDRGQGIPDNFRARIFEPFSQADSGMTRRQSGTGLGLNIARKIVENMNGRMGFSSKVGEGTTFWVEFPLQNLTPYSAGTQPLSLFSEGRIKVLHLEDDLDFHIVLGSGMDGNLDMYHARTLADARQLLKKHRFDLVILDRVIRDGEGLTLIDDIPSPETTRIVVVTGKDENVRHIHVDMTLIKAKTRPDEFVRRFAVIVDDIRQEKRSWGVA